ncbi:single-stranded DNA-binding protein [Bacteroidales bacterium OttesenSCG-928-I21]|nr:single-stranded DNA-binding protein [Bacteroidales bacterium OttesenSCG-928-I21]
MNLRNHVQLIGNLGNAPMLSTLSTGKKMARFSVATNEYTKTNNEVVTKTYWHNVVAWGKTAEIICEKCEKGTEVVINGKLISRTYEDKTGTKKYITEILVNEIICRPKTIAT